MLVDALAIAAERSADAEKLSARLIALAAHSYQRNDFSLHALCCSAILQCFEQIPLSQRAVLADAGASDWHWQKGAELGSTACSAQLTGQRSHANAERTLAKAAGLFRGTVELAPLIGLMPSISLATMLAASLPNWALPRCGEYVPALCATLAQPVQSKVVLIESAPASLAQTSAAILLLRPMLLEVDQHKHMVVIELLAELAARCNIAAWHLAHLVTYGTAPHAVSAGPSPVKLTADHPATLVVRARLRRGTELRWARAARVLMCCPALCSAAAERAARDNLAPGHPELLSPSRAAVIGAHSRASGMARASAELRASGVLEHSQIRTLVRTADRRDLLTAVVRSSAKPSAVGADLTCTAARALIFAMNPKLTRSPAATPQTSVMSLSRVLESLAALPHQSVRALAARAALSPRLRAGHTSVIGEPDAAAQLRWLCSLRGRVLCDATTTALADLALVAARTAAAPSESDAATGPNAEHLACAAMPLLARSRLAAAVVAIDAAMVSPDARLRAAAFEAHAVQARLDGQSQAIGESVWTLRTALGDPHHRVRASAARSLIELVSGPADALLDDAPTEPGRLRMPSLSASAAAGDAAVSTLLELGSSEQNPVGQRAAMWAISRCARSFGQSATHSRILTELVDSILMRAADAQLLSRAQSAAHSLALLGSASIIEPKPMLSGVAA